MRKGHAAKAGPAPSPRDALLECAYEIGIVGTANEHERKKVIALINQQLSEIVSRISAVVVHTLEQTPKQHEEVQDALRKKFAKHKDVVDVLHEPPFGWVNTF